jgi:hypothetical protein
MDCWRRKGYDERTAAWYAFIYLEVNKRNTWEGLEKSEKQMASRLERTPVVQIVKGIAWERLKGKEAEIESINKPKVRCHGPQARPGLVGTW